MNYNLNNPIVKRNTKVVYEDNGNTIKLFNEGYSKADILNEALNQARVEENTDLRIAKLKEVTVMDNKTAIVSEHIKGKTLEQLMNEHPENMDKYLNLFVDIQIEIFSKRVMLINRMKDKYKSRISTSDMYSEEIKYDLLQRLEGMKNHTKLCHGDFVPSNIIITDKGEWYIIDWAHVTQGNASGDIATTYLQFCMDNKKDLAEKYMNLYAEKTNTDKNYIKNWIPIVAANRLYKQKPGEKELLKQWIDVVEPQ